MAPTIIQFPSEHFGYPDQHHGRNGHPIHAICDHIMQGHRAGYHAILHRENGNAAHYSVYRDGSIEQHVADGDAAWGAGDMDHPDLQVEWIRSCYHHHWNPNLLILNIEHEGFSGDPFTQEQTASTCWLHRHLVVTHHLEPDRTGIVGHYQIDSRNRHSDPGSAFPWAAILRTVKL